MRLLSVTLLCKVCWVGSTFVASCCGSKPGSRQGVLGWWLEFCVRTLRVSVGSGRVTGPSVIVQLGCPVGEAERGQGHTRVYLRVQLCL